MSTHYVKIYGTLLTSSVWSEDSDTRVVWITLLAMADADGIARTTIPGLARFAGVSIESCEKALARFADPDPYSGTTDHDGRRIKPIQGGFEVLNHAKYREKQTDKQMKDAERQKRKRERDGRDVSRLSRGVAANTDTNTDTDTVNPPPPPPPQNPAEPVSVEPKPKPSFQPILAVWESECVPRGLAKPLKIDGKRKTALQARACDPEWMKSLPEAIQALLANPFNLGEGPRGWKADLDYFIRPGVATRLIEQYRAGFGSGDGKKTVDQKRDIALTHEEYNGAF